MDVQKLLNRRIPILMLCCALFLILSIDIMIISSMNAQVETLKTDLKEIRLLSSQYSDEKDRLQDEIEQITTEAYVQNKARELYQYMMPDEVRFIVTNPEALYLDEEDVQLVVITDQSIE